FACFSIAHLHKRRRTIHGHRKKIAVDSIGLYGPLDCVSSGQTRKLSAFCPRTRVARWIHQPSGENRLSLVSWELLLLVGCSHDMKSDGIQEVVGSIPIGSTKFLNGLPLTDRPEDSGL